MQEHLHVELKIVTRMQSNCLILAFVAINMKFDDTELLNFTQKKTHKSNEIQRILEFCW